jgi:hypothetical protein
MTVIGICGYGRSGKDTAANHLIQSHAFSHYSVGQPMKEAMVLLDPIIGVHGGHVVRITDVVTDVTDQAQWDEAKDGPYGEEVRVFLQVLGNEASRQILYEDVWADVAERRCATMVAEGRSVVVSSVRFPNEARAIERAGGKIIRVVRPGFGPVNDHPSETAMDDYPVYAEILNDGTIEDLGERVDLILRKLLTP